MAQRFHNPTLADPLTAAAYVARELEPDRVKASYDWLYDPDAGAEDVAQSPAMAQA